MTPLYLLILRDPKIGHTFVPETDMAAATLTDAIAAIDTYDHFEAVSIQFVGRAVTFDATASAWKAIDDAEDASEVQREFVRRTRNAWIKSAMALGKGCPKDWPEQLAAELA